MRAAYLAKTKRYHPNLFALASAETRDMATEVFLLIRRAYSQLGDDAKRRTWRDRIVPPTGPRAILVPSSAPAAPEAPPPAVAGSPPPAAPRSPSTGRTTEQVRALLEEARTRGSRFERARSLVEDGAYGEARAIFHKLASEDPQSRRYRVRMHHAGGMEHLAAGRIEEGVRELERAAALEPENPELARAVAKAKEQRESGRGGIFSKLFGR